MRGIESWFVQCKHFEKGVPPEKLHGAVAWASSERPAVLLVVASNVLSNSAKNWLENYERENLPAFRIKVWAAEQWYRSATPRRRRDFDAKLGSSRGVDR